MTGHGAYCEEGICRCTPAEMLAAALTRVAELEDENAALRAVIDTPHHVAVFDEHGWGLEHSLDCRLAQTMTTCEFNRAMERFGATIDDPADLIGRGPRWVVLGVDANGMPSLQPSPDNGS